MIPVRGDHQAQEVVLELPPGRKNPRNSEGTFVQCHNGRLLFCWSRFTSGTGDHAAAGLAYRWSDDQGRTWSTRSHLLITERARRNVMSPTLLQLNMGGLGLFYLRKHGSADCRLWFRRSADHGRSWSSAVCCISAPGYHVVNNDRVIQLSSGRLIAPAAFHRRLHYRGDEVDLRGICMFHLSDDDGRSWRESPTWWALPLSSGCGLQEPGVIELSNSSLLAWCRNDTGYQWFLRSFDGGTSWTAPEPWESFRSPCSPLSIKSLVDGRLVAVWNDHSGRFPVPPASPQNWGRTPLAMALSSDQGESWTDHRIIENDPQRGFCYTAIHPIDHQTILLAYCAGGGVHGMPLDTIRIRRLTL